jgi:hypothetical protein
MLFATAASAVPITLYGSYSQKDGLYDADDDRGQLSCSVGCSGLTSSLVSGHYDADVPDVLSQSGFSSEYADVFYLANNSDAAELAFVNAVINPDYATGVRTDTGGLSSYTFSSAAVYILLKIGATPDMALIWNTSGQAQTYSYLGFPQEGAGLSHITEYGGPTSVPEPETLLLLVPGVLALALRLRRRPAVAA